MYKSRKSQQGMTAIAMMMLLGLIGFNAVVFIKLFPTYMDSFKVATAVKGIETDDRAEGATDKEIKALITKRLGIDDVDHITNDNIIIEKSGPKRTLHVEYEARVPMFGNIDALFSFKSDEVELR
jgi:hypothetical protein